MDGLGGTIVNEGKSQSLMTPTMMERLVSVCSYLFMGCPGLNMGRYRIYLVFGGQQSMGILERL